MAEGGVLFYYAGLKKGKLGCSMEHMRYCGLRDEDKRFDRSCYQQQWTTDLLTKAILLENFMTLSSNPRQL